MTIVLFWDELLAIDEHVSQWPVFCHFTFVMRVCKQLNVQQVSQQWCCNQMLVNITELSAADPENKMTTTD